MIKNGLLFQNQLNSLIGDSNLSIELIYYILKLKTSEIKQLYIDYLNTNQKNKEGDIKNDES